MNDDELWADAWPHFYAYLHTLPFWALISFATGFGRGMGWWS